MKITDTIAEIALDLGDDHKIAPEKVVKIMDSYYRSIGVVIRFSETPVVLTLDNFGKIFYNELNTLLVERRFKERGIKKKVRKMKRRPITLDEINGFKSGDSSSGTTS